MHCYAQDVKRSSMKRTRPKNCRRLQNHCQWSSSIDCLSTCCAHLRPPVQSCSRWQYYSICTKRILNERMKEHDLCVQNSLDNEYLNCRRWCRWSWLGFVAVWPQRISPMSKLQPWHWEYQKLSLPRTSLLHHHKELLSEHSMLPRPHHKLCLYRLDSLLMERHWASCLSVQLHRQQTSSLQDACPCILWYTLWQFWQLQH